MHVASLHLSFDIFAVVQFSHDCSISNPHINWPILIIFTIKNSLQCQKFELWLSLVEYCNWWLSMSHLLWVLLLNSKNTSFISKGKWMSCYVSTFKDSLWMVMILAVSLARNLKKSLTWIASESGESAPLHGLLAPKCLQYIKWFQDRKKAKCCAFTKMWMWTVKK